MAEPDQTVSFTADLAGLSVEEKANYLDSVATADDLAVLRETDLSSYLEGERNKFKRRKIMEVRDYFLSGKGDDG